MIAQTLQLNLVPKGVWPRLYVSQYDAGSRTLTFEIYNGDQRFTLTSGTTAKIQGTKPDRHGFSYDADVDTSNNVITADITQQMTAAHGEAYCELVLFKSGQRIGTLNFVMMIQQAGLNDETDTSDSDLPDIIAEATEQMLTAEAYAKGTRNGTAVTSGQTGYHDNSKYYKEQAATQASNASTSATSANANALKAEGYAVGKQNGTTQTSGTYYHNNAQYYKEQAASSATNASTKAGEASTSANTASQKASAASTSAQTASDKALVAEGYAKGTQNGTPVGSTSPYYHNNAEYFKNLANPTVAANVSFNNSGTDMSSTNVQDGIVENRTSIQNLSNQVNYNTKNGVKNIMPYPFTNKDGISQYGVKSVDNGDGTVTISGTNTSSTANLIMFRWFNEDTFLQNHVGETLSVSFEGLTTAENVAYAPLIFYDSNGTEISRIVFSSSNTHAEFTVTSAMKTATLRFHVTQSKTVNVTLKAMICLKYLYDADSTWDAPAEPNSILTQKTTGLLDNVNKMGAKNWLPLTLAQLKSCNTDGIWTVGASTATYVISNVTFTVAFDSNEFVTGISVTGTNSTGSRIKFYLIVKNTQASIDFYNFIAKNLGNIVYSLDKSWTETKMSSAIEVYNNGSWKRGIDITGSNVSRVVDLTISDCNQASATLFFDNGAVGTGVQAKPMVSFKSMYDVDPTFAPYAKSNRELTEDVAKLTIKTATFSANTGTNGIVASGIPEAKAPKCIPISVSFTSTAPPPCAGFEYNNSYGAWYIRCKSWDGSLKQNADVAGTISYIDLN